MRISSWRVRLRCRSTRRRSPTPLRSASSQRGGSNRQTTRRHRRIARIHPVAWMPWSAASSGFPPRHYRRLLRHPHGSRPPPWRARARSRHSSSGRRCGSRYSVRRCSVRRCCLTLRDAALRALRGGDAPRRARGVERRFRLPRLYLDRASRIERSTHRVAHSRCSRPSSFTDRLLVTCACVHSVSETRNCVRCSCPCPRCEMTRDSISF